MPNDPNDWNWNDNEHIARLLRLGMWLCTSAAATWAAYAILSKEPTALLATALYLVLAWVSWFAAERYK